MRALFGICSTASVLVVLCGCSNREASLVGKWTATDVQFPANPMASGVFKSQLGMFGLTLNADRHFSFIQESGTWSLDGDKVVLTVQSVEGKSLSEAKSDAKEKLKEQRNGAMGGVNDAELDAVFDSMKNQAGTLSKDGKTMTIPFPGGDKLKGTITLVKQPS